MWRRSRRSAKGYKAHFHQAGSDSGLVTHRECKGRLKSRLPSVRRGVVEECERDLLRRPWAVAKAVRAADSLGRLAAPAVLFRDRFRPSLPPPGSKLEEA